MDDFRLLIDLHRDGDRQGPGSDTATRLALDIAGLDRTAPLKVADIGCGTGASTLLLAELLNAHITAVDFLPEFLDVLKGRAERAGVANKISPIACSMDDLPFDYGEFDVLWSEGAIYNIGFETGVKKWRPFLKEGGLFVASEITWLTGARPPELQEYWGRQYPEIDVASAKIRVLEEHGFSPVGYFALPEDCWLEEYYHPMQSRFEDFLKRNGGSKEAREVVSAEREEIALYEEFRSLYGYGVYIARKAK